MKKVLITGLTGQDGHYMAELLLSKGYCVVGGVRDSAASYFKLGATLANKVHLLNWDMSNQENMTRLLADINPAEIYNFAAYTSGSGMYDDPVNICDVNGLAVLRILEAIRAVNKDIRFCQVFYALTSTRIISLYPYRFVPQVFDQLKIWLYPT